MTWVSETVAAEAVAALGGDPRIVVSGNHATPRTPWSQAIDSAVPEYRLWALNAQSGMPDRDGVTLETSFVGPGMRRSPQLRYIPSRLSLVPVLFRKRAAARRRGGAHLTRR